MRKATLALAVAVAALTIGATTAQAEIHVYDLDSDPQGSVQCSPVGTYSGGVSGGCDLPLKITEPFVSHYDGYEEVEYPGCELTLNTFVAGAGYLAVHDVDFSQDCHWAAEANGLPWWGEIESNGGTFTVDLPVDIYAGNSSYSNTHGPITGTKQFEISDPDSDNLWTFHYYEEKEMWPGSGFPEYYTSFGGDFDSQSGLIDIVDVN